jgi:hypothetical protein
VHAVMTLMYHPKDLSWYHGCATATGVSTGLLYYLQIASQPSANSGGSSAEEMHSSRKSFRADRTGRTVDQLTGQQNSEDKTPPNYSRCHKCSLWLST